MCVSEYFEGNFRADQREKFEELTHIYVQLKQIIRINLIKTVVRDLSL